MISNILKFIGSVCVIRTDDMFDHRSNVVL